jgi:hypothetical protein
MPATRHQIPPQTSKKARKAYLKANKHFEFTPTQARASERRLELEKRAKGLEAKEQRKKDNKRKREEKEAFEREAKRKRIESGKAPIEALWGKVRASQPRLHAFFAQPKAADDKVNDHSENEDEPNLGYDSYAEEEVGDKTIEQAAQDSAAETEGLEDFFFLEGSINSTDMAPALDSNAAETPAELEIDDPVVDAKNANNAALSQREDPDQVLPDTQLLLSQGIFDFDIAEDDDAEWMPLEVKNVNRSNGVEGPNMQSRLLGTPSKRKAEHDNSEFTSPAKSARSALSEMSPSKVNIRAQEKPDIFSVLPFPSKLPTPSPAKQPGRQTTDELLAMIAMQDFEDDEFLTDKENADPFQSESKGGSQKKDGVQKITSTSGSIIKHDSPSTPNLVKNVQVQHLSFDEDIFDSDDFSALESGLEDEQDDYDNDLDDEALAALAASSPSAHKLALMSSRHPQTMAGGKLETKELTTSTDRQEHVRAATGMQHPMQAALAKAQVASPGLQHQLPPATQGNSFAFDDVQDDDLTSLVEEYDIAQAKPGEQARSQSKPSRMIPWNHPLQFQLPQGSDEQLTQDEDPYD